MAYRAGYSLAVVTESRAASRRGSHNLGAGIVATVVLQLDPARLSNPDLDIRYALPDLLVERSSGRLTDDGYDYAGEGSAPCLLLFLRADDVKAAIPGIIEVLKSERVLGNDLSCVPVAVEDGDQLRVVHPPGFEGTFRWPGGR